MIVGRDERRRTFEVWLRTGRLPTLSDSGTELKFNPWHDPDDGKFTHAGAGRYFGHGGAQPAEHRTNRERKVGTDGGRKPSPGNPVKKVAEFVGGAGRAAKDFGKETITSLHDIATTNPMKTVKTFGEGVAKTIDTALAAEDTPARVQIRRAKNAVANASAEDLGYATGRVLANAALATAPGAAATKVSAIRQLRLARPRETFHPPEIKWVKENLGKDSRAKAYNDAATGARPGHAPALMRTLPDGKQRPVKFDGIDGDYVIDRKMSVVGKPRAQAQILRQSEVLSQHRLTGVWEVPDDAQRTAARKLLTKWNVKNIRVRIVKP